ncbi:MAG: hypothetical protein ACU4EQ_08345 [Candidatus Nitrosoglobus sp.]|jgi:hypothetical protein
MRSSTIILALIAALGSLTGCVTVKNIPLSADASANLSGKSVSTTRYPKADFAAVTAGKALLGGIGGLVAVADGNKIIDENEIEDPAIKISQILEKYLSEKRSMRAIGKGEAIATNDKIPTLIATYPSADYLLDVRTLSWMFFYYPTNWSHYRISYSARIRLIDARKNEIAAETLCKSSPVDDNNPPSKDQLLENKAALLKSYLEKAASACADAFSKHILQL